MELTGTAAAELAADGAGAQAPATVVPPGMRSGPWNRSDRVRLEDAVSVARLFGASCVRVIRPGYATIEVDLKHEKPIPSSSSPSRPNLVRSS